jgi:hypothetical protein
MKNKKYLKTNYQCAIIFIVQETNYDVADDSNIQQLNSRVTNLKWKILRNSGQM